MGKFTKLNKIVESFISENLVPAEGPVFSNTEKFNSVQEYKDTIEKCRKEGYKVEPQMENGILLNLVYDQNDQHVGTFNNRTLEFFFDGELNEDADTLCDKVDAAQSTLKSLIDIIRTSKIEEDVDRIQVGDKVIRKFDQSKRQGIVKRHINNDVWEVEYPKNGFEPARTDKHYEDDLVKIQEDVVDEIELISNWIKRLGFVEGSGLTDFRKDNRTIVMEDDKLFYEGDDIKREFPINNDLDIERAFQAIEKLENSLKESFEDNHIEIEVEFTDGTTSDEFSVLNGTLLFGDSEIAELYDENDEEEIKDKIVTYCDLELEQEVEDIYIIGMEKSDDYYSDDKEQRLSDLMGEALDVEDNGIESAEDTLVANGNEYKALKTKAGMKSWIYKNVKYSGLFHDEFWGGYRTILDQIKGLGYEVISGPANDSHHNNGYSLDGKEKAWDIAITSKEGIQVFGQIKAQAAGTVEDPMSSYDMILILY